MPVILPEIPTPPPHVRFTWSLTINDTQLAALIETSISDPLVHMRVRPSGLEKAPHVVKLSVHAEAADAVRLFNEINVNLQRYNIG